MYRIRIYLALKAIELSNLKSFFVKRAFYTKRGLSGQETTALLGVFIQKKS